MYFKKRQCDLLSRLFLLMVETVLEAKCALSKCHFFNELQTSFGVTGNLQM